jgi:hypothetical protein
MNIQKASKRDNKIQKRKNGHREDGRSVFTIKRLQKERALQIEQERKRKEAILVGDD